ncbi:hypothetical protein DOY81_008105 [Sarcophaga bullata]|nr:hypothetical protein DOY81_008105 [Sarcophaga bullata]
MPLFYKLLIFICFLSMVLSVPIISAGISFGTPIYYEHPATIYYERPYYSNYPSRYPYDYPSHNYEYVSGGIGGFHGSIGYSPFGF